MLAEYVVDADAAILLPVEELTSAQPGAIVVRRFVALLHKVLQFELLSLRVAANVYRGETKLLN